MSFAAAQKKLELKLVVTADTLQGSMALQQLAAQAARVNDSLQKVNQSAAGAKSLAGRALATPNLADRYNNSALGKTFGSTSELGALASRAVAPVAVAAGLAATAANMTHALGQLDNQLLTAREKALGFARALPLVGDALAGLIDNAMDAIDRINDPELAARVDRGRIEEPILRRNDQARFDARMKGQRLYEESRTAQNQLSAVRAYPTLAYTEQRSLEQPGILGAASAIAFGAYHTGQDPRVTEQLEAIQLAKRGAGFAQREFDASANDVGLARRDRDSATRRAEAARALTEAEEAAAKNMALPTGSERDRAAQRQYQQTYSVYSGTNRFQNHAADVAAQVGGAIGYAFPSFTRPFSGGAAGTKNSYEDARRAETAALQRQQQALADLEAKITANKQKQLELLQKQQEVSRAEVNLQKTRLAVVDEQIAKVRGGTLGYAALDKSSQSDLLDAARRFKSGGRENVSSEELSLLQGNSLTSGLVQDRLEEDLKNKKVSGVDDLLNVTGQRDLDALQAARKGIKADLALSVQLDEEKFALLVSEKLKGLNLKELIGEIVTQGLKVELRKNQLDADRARLERGGGG